MVNASRAVSTEYFRFRLRLVLGLLMVACLTLGAVAWKITSSMHDRENAVRTQSQAYVQTIAAHVSDSIQLADHALTGLTHAIQALPPEQRNSAAIRDLLISHDPGSSDDLSVKFVDVDGFAIAATNHVPLSGVSFKDTDFFRAHSGSEAGADLYVGQPVIARVTRKRIFTLSRRVFGAQGEFLGIVMLPMDAARFASMFELARLNRDITIGLVREGGKVIARVPLFEQTFAVNLLASSNSIFRQLYEPPATGIKLNSALDGRSMIFSARALQKLPLFVVVGISVEELQQLLRDDLLIGGAGIVLMLTIMLLITRLALNAYRSLDIKKQGLQESEFRLKFGLEGIGDGLWDWNVASGTVYFTLHCKNMLGYADDAMGDTFAAWESLLHPDDRSRVLATLQGCLDGGESVYASEYRLRCKDGGWKWILARGMVNSRDAGGRALRMIGTHADISERKQSERAQVHKIIEAAPAPMLLVADDGVIIFANGAARTTFGYVLLDLEGRNIDELAPCHEGSHVDWRKGRASSAATQPMIEGKVRQTGLHLDGSEFPIEVSVSTFQMDGQTVIIASISDISEREQAADLLKKSLAELRRLSDHQQNVKEDERTRIAQDLHDDLGQNLLVLKMDVDTLYARTRAAHPKLNGRVRLALDNIDGTIKSVKAIMNNLRPATLELGLYPAVEWQLRQFERSSGIVCRLLASEEVAGRQLDQVRIAAVFRILQESLTNVARHAKASEVQVALVQDEHGFSMSVADNGRGLDAGDRRKGNSFGLMGIRERIDALGGELDIASSPGHGTVLSIRLPIDKVGSISLS